MGTMTELVTGTSPRSRPRPLSSIPSITSSSQTLRLTEGRDSPVPQEERLSPIGYARRNRDSGGLRQQTPSPTRKMKEAFSSENLSKMERQRTPSPRKPWRESLDKPWKEKETSPDRFTSATSENVEAAVNAGTISNRHTSSCMQLTGVCSQKRKAMAEDEDTDEIDYDYQQYNSLGSGFPLALLQKRESSLSMGTNSPLPLPDSRQDKMKFLESKSFTQSMSLLPTSQREKDDFKSPVDVLRQRRNSKSFLAPEEEDEALSQLPSDNLAQYAPGTVFPLIKDELYYTVLDGSLTPELLKSPQNSHVAQFNCVSCSCKAPSHLKSTETEHNIPDLAITHKFVSWLGKKITALRSRLHSIDHNHSIKSHDLKQKVLVFKIPEEASARRNFVFLLGAYLLIKADLCTPEMAWQPFVHPGIPMDSFLLPNASGQALSLSVLDCLKGLYKAMVKGWYDFPTFDVVKYEDLRKAENGEMVWVSPKVLLMHGPADEGTKTGMELTTAQCKELLQDRGVSGVIRSSNPGYYSAHQFQNAGMSHFDFFIASGTTPKDEMISKFLRACELNKGPVAIHSENSMGRAATLAAVWLIKKEKFTGNEALTWIRIIRPGSFVGHQAQFLVSLAGRVEKMQVQSDFKRTISAPAPNESKLDEGRQRPLFRPRSRLKSELSHLLGRRQKVVEKIGVPRQDLKLPPEVEPPAIAKVSSEKPSNFDAFMEMISTQDSGEGEEYQERTWHGTGTKKSRRKALESKWDLAGMEDAHASHLVSSNFNTDSLSRRPTASLFRRIVGDDE